MEENDMIIIRQEREIIALENKIELLEKENEALNKSIDSLVASGRLLTRQYKELEEAGQRVIGGMRKLKFLQQ